MRKLFFSSCCLIALIAGGQQTQAATLTISANQLQDIDGFGFFGPMMSWWSSSSAAAFYTPAWLALVIDTLGLTIWRNEYYSEEANQDANWAKQKPFVQALKAKADASKVTIKFIFTVWSPPSKWKSNNSLKNGGNLLPQYFPDFANWLIKGVRAYEAAGVPLYGLSPQNEPLFQETYNSCVYTNVTYADMLKAIGPIVHDSCPNVKIFGPEHMLFGAGKDYDFANLDPSGKIFSDSAAKVQLDFWACHGYGADGQTPTANNLEAQYWTKAWQKVGAVTGKRMWMTETSGYSDDWASAMDYIESVHAALFYGRVNGWVHWYGAGDIVTNTALTTKGTLLKHYARFVRPGAKALLTSASDSTLLCTAYTNAADNSFTIVIINSGAAASTIALSGAGLPADFHQYESTSSEKCVDKRVITGTSVTVPAGSVTTLYHSAPTPVRHSLDKRPFNRPKSSVKYYTCNGQELRSFTLFSHQGFILMQSVDGTVHPVVQFR